MNLVLTGATGYLGSRLACQFLATGHRVVALKRRASSMRRLADCADGLLLYDVDDGGLTADFWNASDVDAVIHCATCYGRKGESTSEVLTTNTVLPVQLLERAVAHNVPTFINVDTVLDPRTNAYALSKAQFVEWGRQMTRESGTRFVNVRMESIYGPGDDASKFPIWLIEACRKNVPEIPLTSGTQRRDFIYIDDAVSAFECLLTNAESLSSAFQELGLGTGQAVAIRAVAEMIHAYTQSHSRLHFGAIPSRPNELMESASDLSLLRSLGWCARTSIDEGIQRLTNHASMG